MHRTQILLDEAQYAFLLERSRMEKVGLSGLLRRLVAEAMAETDRDDALARLAGIGEGDGAPEGREHDRFLYGERR
jgi:hypothetical protein